MAEPYETLEIDDSDVYPDEKPSRIQSLKALMGRPVCKILLISVAVTLLFVASFGGAIGIGYSIGKAVNQESCDCECECPEPAPGATFYSIDDFDSEPIPDLPNVFDPLELKPLDIQEWPEGTYHPLLPVKQSPDYVFRYIDDYDIDRNDITQRALLESNEYQIRLNGNRFIDRMQGVEEFQQIIGQFIAPYISSLEEPVEMMWYELQYEKHGCGADYDELRVRSYITGKHSNTATSSVNRDVKTKVEAVETMMYPNADYLDHFEMKLEQDIHVCRSKFNRKVKLKGLPYGTEFTCESLKYFYPTVFYDTTLVEDNPLELHSNKTWWNYSQEGYLFGNTTKFKTSFNIGYEPGEEAFIEGSKPNHSSEWSMRIYSFDDGYGVWDEYVLTTIGEFYKFIIDNYGSHQEDPEDC